MFSMERAWADLIAMFRTHREAIVAIAGIFAFLPSLAYNIFVPRPEITPGNVNAPAMMAEFFATWWPVLLAMALLSMFGGLAVLCLVLTDRPGLVRDALSKAMRLWLGAIGFWLLCVLAGFVATLIAGVAVGIVSFAIFGRSTIGAIVTFFALLPALYLLGRTAVGNALIVAEDERNPVRAFSASFALSKGRGWSIAAMFVIIFLVYFVILFSLTAVTGIAVSLIAPAAGPFVQGLIMALLAAAMNVMTFLLSATIYRQLSSTRPAAAGS